MLLANVFYALPRIGTLLSPLINHLTESLEQPSPFTDGEIEAQGHAGQWQQRGVDE